MLSAVLAVGACGADDPVSLYDGLGEVETDQVVTLSQIDLSYQGPSDEKTDRCFSLEEADSGIFCDAEVAELVFDGDFWALTLSESGDYDLQPIDTGWQCTEDGKVCGRVTSSKPPSESRWAECGCPEGCSDTDCRWEYGTSSNSYTCEGECRGAHCSECTVDFTSSPAETAAPIE
jgi:hypothetical protein